MPERGSPPEETRRSPLAFFHMERSRVDAILSKDLGKHFWILRDEVLALCRANGVEHPKDLERVSQVSTQTLQQCVRLLKGMEHILLEKELPPLLLYQEEDEDHLDYRKEDTEAFSFELPAFVKTGPMLDAGGKMVMSGQMPNGRWVVINHRGNTLGNPEGYKEMGPVVYENGRILFAASDRDVWTLFDERGTPILSLPEYRRVEKIARVGKEIAILAQTKEGRRYRWLNDTGCPVLPDDFRAVDEVFAQDGRVAFIARTFENWPASSVWALDNQFGSEMVIGGRLPLPTKTTQISRAWRGQPTTNIEPTFSQPELKKILRKKDGGVLFGIRERGAKNSWKIADWMGVGSRLCEGSYQDILTMQETHNGYVRVLAPWRGGYRWMLADEPINSDWDSQFYEMEKLFSHPGQPLCSARFSKSSKRVQICTPLTGRLKVGDREGYASVEDAMCMGGTEPKHYVFAARRKKDDAKCGIYIQPTFVNTETLVGSMDRVDRLGALSDGRFYAVGREGKDMVKHVFEVKMKDR